MGKIIEYVAKAFDDHRNNKITLKELMLRLCRYADKNIQYQHLMDIFEEALEKEFDKEGNIAQ